MTEKKTGIRTSLSVAERGMCRGRKKRTYIHWLRVGRESPGRNAERILKGIPSMVLSLI